jgi:hypothetical protein
MHDHCPGPCRKIRAAFPCPCCMSMSMLHVHVHVHAACPCPCCMSVSILHAMSMLHVHVNATFHVKAAFHVNASCPCLCPFTHMEKCQNAGLSGIQSVRYRTEKKLTMLTQSGIILVWYRTKIRDAGMPMPALVCSMPMPSYGDNAF